MNSSDMTKRPPRRPPAEPKQSKTSDAAFDLWLHRGLHKLYDSISEEPVPEELLKLIEDSRKE